MIIENTCTRCGGYLVPDKDLIYDINYLKCVKCGNVLFDSNDGFGHLKLKLPTEEKRYELICTICNKIFISKSPNRPVCYRKSCLNKRRQNAKV